MRPVITEQEELETRLEKSRLSKQVIDIFIWTSASNPHETGRGCGHAAIKTPNHYISLWPSAGGKQSGSGLFQRIDHEYKASYEEDLKAERREPELVFRFYTLDVQKLEEEFDKLKRTIEGWAAMPKLLLFTKDIESCVTIVWKCLAAGNIGKYAGMLVQSSVGSVGTLHGSGQSGQASGGFFSSLFGKQPEIDSREQSTKAVIYTAEMLFGIPIKSPDYLGQLLKEAKVNEYGQCPLTKILDEEGNSNESVPTFS